MTAKPLGAHLVGSVPVENAETMFRLSMTHLSGHLKRLPDGETGERDTWIRWQYAKLASSPQITALPQENHYVPVRPLQVVDGIGSADAVQMPNLGYADAALESYAVFQRMVNENVIPSGIRFQVGLPTPLSVAILYVHPASRDLFETAYRRALAHELERMLDGIPAASLAIQWETVSEFALLEGLLDNHLDGDLLDNITTRVAALVDLIPQSVEAGLHLCYGDSGHKHFCEPRDAGYLAQVGNGVLAKADRPIDWIHMPVPKERDDGGYFVPLADLDLPRSTELYLGLVHATGGKEGTLSRIATASQFVPRFGVATECGLGRRDPASIPEIMKQHAEVATPYS